MTRLRYGGSGVVAAAAAEPWPTTYAARKSGSAPDRERGRSQVELVEEVLDRDVEIHLRPSFGCESGHRCGVIKIHRYKVNISVSATQ